MRENSHNIPTRMMMMMMTADNNNDNEVEIPEEFICPLTMELMQDPVMSRYGQSYERDAILNWLHRGHTDCPCTRQPLRLRDLVSNHQLRLRIHKWQLENQEDITVFIQPNNNDDDNNNVLGFITVPEKDTDETERTQDDNSVIVEQPQPRRRWSTGRRLSLGSFRSGERRLSLFSRLSRRNS